MKEPLFIRRFLGTTRGQILLHLRQSSCTVADLAQKLGLTDNAIRAHLSVLERDGLAIQKGERSGFRKPHLVYELSKEAEELFPKAYCNVLGTLLSVLKEREGMTQLKDVLRMVGDQIIESDLLSLKSSSSDPVDRAVRALQRLGGSVEIEREKGKVLLRGQGCPLSGVTVDHQEVCDMVRKILQELADVRVTQACLRSEKPCCGFEIDPSPEK